jgi:hypothetical protein
MHVSLAITRVKYALALLQRLSEIPEWFRGTVAGSEVELEILSDNHERRAVLVAEKEQLRSDLDAALPRLTAEVEATQAAYDDVIAAIRPALDRRNNSRGKRSKTNSQYQRKIDVIDRQLSETCDPRIEAELEKWDQEYQRIRVLKPQTWQTSKKRTDKTTGYKTDDVTTFSNRVALTEILESVQQATVELKALRTENPDDIEQAIEDITGELPPIGSVNSSYGAK